MNRPTLFLDFDGVMSIDDDSSSSYPTFNSVHPFKKECVDVLNSIIEITNPIIVCSSDWNLRLSIPHLNLVFQWYGVNGVISDITPSLWKVKYKSFQDLDECRAQEILMYVEEHGITNFVAVDDLILTQWIPDNFVLCAHPATEGIMQSGVKNKIIDIIKK